MKNYTYISIMVLLSFVPCIQAMHKATSKKEETTSKEDLLGEGFFVDIDDTKAFVVSDTTTSSVEDDEEAFGEALLKQKRLQSAGKARLQSAFPINRAHAGLIQISESHMPDTEVHANPLADYVQISHSAVSILVMPEVGAKASSLVDRFPDDFLLHRAELGDSIELIVCGSFASASAAPGHHRSLPLSGNEAYDTAGFPISTARRLAQPLPTVPEADEEDTLSAFVAETLFSERGLKSK